MTLTEEQRERIRVNRERALEIKRRKQEEREQAARCAARNNNSATGVDDKKRPVSTTSGTRGQGGSPKRLKVSEGNNNKSKEVKGEESDEELEQFEEGASDFVSKAEAKKMYCLPEGTLAVCAVIEKENPHNRAFASLKLYQRSEIRRRARARFGGREGLIAERRKREEGRFRNDVQKTKNIFKK